MTPAEAFKVIFLFQVPENLISVWNKTSFEAARALGSLRLIASFEVYNTEKQIQPRLRIFQPRSFVSGHEM